MHTVIANRIGGKGTVEKHNVWAVANRQCPAEKTIHVGIGRTADQLQAFDFARRGQFTDK